MAGEFEEYKHKVTEDVKRILDDLECQPILFIGSGLSKRYFSGPNWEELLKEMAGQCPKINKQFAYYKQSYKSLIEIGEEYANIYKEWAWEKGNEEFPEKLFDASYPPEIYFKFKVAKYFDSILPTSLDTMEDPYNKEIELLKEIRPHAIVTTNYDRFLEMVFPEYTPIIGQKILYANHASIGEIFKIHGCTSRPNSIVITEKDYNEFNTRKKYLSSKLLTYFAEHPLLILGYSASDPNIRAILSDIDEIISPDEDLIPNIYLLNWEDNIRETDNPPLERVIPIDSNKSVRIKNITASELDWVFDAFGANSEIEKINPKLLRALLARTYELVRTDIPRKTVEVDYDTLEHAVKQDGQLASIYGISTFDNPATVNAVYPYTLTKVGEKLGYETWHKAHQLIERVREEKDFDIKSSDNKYHIGIKSGDSSQTRKYSEATVELLKKVRNEEEYEVEERKVEYENIK